MPNYTEKKVVREYTEWRIPLRSLGTLSEWDALRAAVIAVIGDKAAEHCDILDVRMGGDDDYPDVILSYQHVPRLVLDDQGNARLSTQVIGGLQLTPKEVVELAMVHQSIAGGSVAVADKLAVLVGDKDPSGRRLGPAGVALTIDPTLKSHELRIGNQVYRLEGNGRAYLVPFPDAGA